MPTSMLLQRALARPSHSAAVRPLSRSHRRPSNVFITRNSHRTQSSSTSPVPPSTNAASPESIAQRAPTPIEAKGAGQAASEAKKLDAIPVCHVIAPLPFWERLGPLTRAGQAYGRAQRSRPWATQVASAFVIYLCADFGAQQMSIGAEGDDDNAKGKKEKKHDWARTARSLIIGCAAAIPGYIWFTFLSRSLNYSSKVLSIAAKVVVNQITFTPVFNVYFFGSQALLSGDTPGEAWRRVCNTVPVSFVNSCKLWPAVTAFSFAFIPLEYRSVFAGVIAVGWQTYLSFLNSRAERLEALRQKEALVAIDVRPSASRPSERIDSSPAAVVAVAVAS
ncbi:hypothetical protein GGR50DRAFT_646803 [Xylaria sp. CBS 124048]|nr:hypothetical protein GGR50DRAFT_646803 [Xylaria sp. CBS 124048]